MQITSPSEKYAPVGYCIYCRAHGVPLTDEHIIPLGLGGNLVLPKASCAKCAAITGRIEQFCLRNMFGVVRARMQFPTRRPKERHRLSPLHIVQNDNSVSTKQIPISDFPFGIVLARLQPPRILLGLPPVQNFPGADFWRANIPDELQATATRFGGKGFRLGSFHAGYFTRMLAKIGHAFAVADQGLDKFTPLLSDMIVGNYDTPNYLVGGNGHTETPATSMVHQLHLEVGWVDGVDYSSIGPTDIQFLIVHIRLFAFLGSPQYHVVVGIWHKGRQKRLQ